MKAAWWTVSHSSLSYQWFWDYFYRKLHIRMKSVKPFSDHSSLKEPSAFFFLLIIWTWKKKGWCCMQWNDEANKRKKRISPLNYFHVKSLMINLIINFISSSLSSTSFFFGNMFGITLNQFYGLKLDRHQNWLR